MKITSKMLSFGMIYISQIVQSPSLANLEEKDKLCTFSEITQTPFNKENTQQCIFTPSVFNLGRIFASLMENILFWRKKKK